MKYCQKHKGLKIGAYAIMTNHVHVIWQSENGKLSDILRDFKSYCTKEFISIIQKESESRRDWLLHMFRFHANRTNQNKEYKIWTGDNHPEEIFSKDFFLSKINTFMKIPSGPVGLQGRKIGFIVALVLITAIKHL